MMLALELGATPVLVGLIQGLAYALLGLGLVLIYRATRVVHFGYGEVGAFGSLVLAKLVLDSGWPWLASLLVVVAIGSLLGAMWELLVVRRLSESSRLVLLVATIGIAQVMVAAQIILPSVENIQIYPAAFELRRSIGSFTLRGDHVAVIVLVPAVAAALAWFLNRTKYGLAIKCAAENQDAASLAGVRVKPLSTAVWAIGGGLATLSFVLLSPVRGLGVAGEAAAVGPSLLLRALLVALVGRLVSLPLTVVGGVAFGVVESLLYANATAPTVELCIFGLLVVLLLVRGAAAAGSDVASIGGRVRAVPARFADVRWVALLPRTTVAVGAAFAVLLPLVVSNPSRQFTFAKVLVYVLIALSVVVITGWAGQLSLCQFAFVGLGAYSTAGLTDRGMPFLWAGVNAVVITTIVATAVGFPALRLKGLSLAVVTLGFAQVTHAWILPNDVFASATSGRAVVQRASIGPLDLTDQRTYYYFCLVVLVLVLGALATLRRSGVGRSIIAVRENEAAASAATISPRSAKLLAFAISGAVAGLGGALLGGLFVEVSGTDFSAQQSIVVLTMGIIGGVGSLAGAVLGALYIIGLPNLLGGGNLVTIMISGVGLMVLVLFVPGGLIEVVQRARDGLVERFASARAEDVEPSLPEGATADVATAVRSFATLPVGPRAAPSDAGGPVLACHQVSVRFGGLVANDAVDLQVGRGEVVGLIGTNGAGKSTLMNAVGGYVEIAEGSVEIFGHDVTWWPPHERSKLGVGRVFQDARLFGDLTVRECVMVGLEARRRAEVVPTLLHLPPATHAERVKRSVADEIVELTGLQRYTDATVSELSTGTRRIVELAGLIAGGSRLLLLDEPTGGIAQREVEAFGAVIRDVRDQLDASIMIIEHDMPLVMSLSDRIVCMTAGRVIAEGPPGDIRRDPAVIAAYLGTDDRAIDRSDLVGGRHG